LEIISEAIRQTSQLSIPVDAWKQVLSWVKDLTVQLKELSGSRDTMFVIDCNPSFAIYTQLALVAADYVVVPFTGDDSSRRAVENVVALLYGYGDAHTAAYASISFSKKANAEGLDIPLLHTFISNRQTLFDGRPTKAFEAVNSVIQKTVDEIYAKHRSIFANKKQKPSENFLEVPDYHGASIVAAMTGTPLHALKAGPKDLEGERIQINPEPLKRYKKALQNVVDCF
jgi:cellulose biosynthesis protein BcsQ